MRKYLTIVLVCFLFASLSFTNAFASTEIKKSTQQAVEISSYPEDAPNWAVGNFTGTWGLNVWGHNWFSIGPVEGYYGKGFIRNIKFGRFLITYMQADGENGTILQGLFVGPYLLGTSKDIRTENKTAFVGLGSYNETDFGWRIMGMKGPTLFMKGTFNKF